jgi:hypothetical protein
MFLAFTGAARAGFTLIIPFTNSGQGAQLAIHAPHAQGEFIHPPADSRTL